MSSTCKGLRFPREIIAHCVWLYHRFTLSFREIELLMAERGTEVTYEPIRLWCARFGPDYARRLRHRMTATGHRTEIRTRFQIWDQVVELATTVDFVGPY